MYIRYFSLNHKLLFITSPDLSHDSYIYDSWAESYIRPTPSAAVTATAAASSPPLQHSPILNSPPTEATVTKDHNGA